MDSTIANDNSSGPVLRVSDAEKTSAPARPTGWGEVVLFAIAGLLILAAGAIGWWHVIGQGEPWYVKAFRGIVVIGGVGVILSAFVSRLRSIVLPIAALLAFILPVLMVQYIVTRDPLTMDRVDMQTRQSNWLLICLQRTQDMPYVPWIEPKATTATPNRSNVYNIFDGFEIIPVFSKGGWYLSIVAGAIGLVIALFYFGPQIRNGIIRYRIGIVAIVVLMTLYFYAGPFMAFLYWNRARAAGAAGDYATAIYYDKQIPKVDPRWTYDMNYHGEIGRFYGHLGLTQEPDYWSFVGDTMVRGGRYKAAMLIYQSHFGRNMDRTTRMRYVHVLVLLGTQTFRQQRYGEAIDLWRRAVSLDPSNVEALYFYGFGLTKMGRYYEAVPIWKALISDNEGVGMYRLKFFANRRYRKEITSRAWNLLSWCYYQIDDYDSAMHCRYNSLQAGATDVKALPDTMSAGAAAVDPVDGADPTAFVDADE